MDILLYIVLLIVGFHLGELVTAWRLRKVFKRLAEDLGINWNKAVSDEEEKPLTKKINVRKLEIEKVNDTLYLYDRETKDFICQGKTVDELAKLANEYKNITGAVVLDGERVFTFVCGMSEEFTV